MPRLIWWWPDPSEQVITHRKEDVIVNMQHQGDTHKCTVCSCEFTDDEGGVQGYFGILPVAFCPTCYSSMYDMVQQDMNEEWV